MTRGNHFEVACVNLIDRIVIVFIETLANSNLQLLTWQLKFGNSKIKVRFPSAMRFFKLAS